MEVKFDFSLNHRFHGVVEQGIFRLVLRGIDSRPQKILCNRQSMTV